MKSKLCRSASRMVDTATRSVSKHMAPKVRVDVKDGRLRNKVDAKAYDAKSRSTPDIGAKPTRPCFTFFFAKICS
jgi:hypothetical protein